MAWTATDLSDIEAAIRTAMVAGIASVSLAGQQVQAYTLKELRELRAEIKGELAAANPLSLGGMRTRKTVPPEAG
jgi:hypothetical protein